MPSTETTTYATALPGCSLTAKGEPGCEVGSQIIIAGVGVYNGSVKVSDYSGPVTYSSSNPDVFSINGTTITGVGFGQATLTALDSNNKVLTAGILYVGSVIILGADGLSWRLFPDGSVAGPLTPENSDISNRIQALEGKNILFAEVGNNRIYDATPTPMEYSISDRETSVTAVTCYLLNLQKVTRQG
ncbi:MAG TPA: hypothetical protein VEU33_44130 [Archangium sp.]|nr:hypothetical protein [Archangium sp.]